MNWVREHVAGVAAMSVLVIGLGVNWMTSVDTFVEGEYDQAEMDAAIADARANLDQFLEAFEQNDGEEFMVKVPIADGDAVEVIWLSHIRFNDGQFRGRIANVPRVVSNVSSGQEWTVGKDEIVDWLIIRNEKVHGNYTARPLLRAMTPKQRMRAESMLAEP